ncbi:MAG: hypothetical protein KY457_14145 [Actinobacteria bacterium]|nr:hypothetical protein [Actinomycetota bacterium]
MSRRTVLTAVIALSAFGLTAGLTASLNVATDDLGAATATVAACHPPAEGDITLSYGVRAGVVNEVVEVTLGNVSAACTGQAATVTLMDAAGAAVDSVVATSLTADGVSDIVLDLAADATLTADASLVEKVSVVITGA